MHTQYKKSDFHSCMKYILQKQGNYRAITFILPTSDVQNYYRARNKGSPRFRHLFKQTGCAIK